MAIADRYLADDEELVHVARQHWTVLMGEFVVLVLILAAVGAGLWFLPWNEEWSTIAALAIAGAGVLAAMVFCLVPMARWSTTVYVLTNQRLMTHEGLVSKQGRSMPLTRVNDVSYNISLWERLMRYGTLSVKSASENESMMLQRVPRPQWFQAEIYRQVSSAQSPGNPSGPPA